MRRYKTRSASSGGGMGIRANVRDVLTILLETGPNSNDLDDLGRLKEEPLIPGSTLDAPISSSVEGIRRIHVCRRCGSTKVRRSRRNGLVDRVLQLLRVGHYRCFDCYERFYDLHQSSCATFTHPTSNRLARHRLAAGEPIPRSSHSCRQKVSPTPFRRKP
jgi:hypothetical protein